MILEAVFKEEAALKAEFGVLTRGEKGNKGDKGDAGIVDYARAANALKGSARGNPLVLSDVSPLEHEIKVKLTSVEPIYEEVESTGAEFYFYSGDGVYVVTEVVQEPNDGQCFYFADGSSVINADNLPKDTKYFVVKDGIPYYISNEWADVNGATVQKYGKNLFNYKDFVAYANSVFVISDEGIYVGFN